MRHDHYRPAGFHYLKGGVDASGKLVAWNNHFVTFGEGTDRSRRSADIAPTSSRPASSANFAFEASADADWACRPARCARRAATPSRSCSSRSSTNWRIAAGKDPLQFRLELLNVPRVALMTDRPGRPDRARCDAARMKGVLELVREKSGWGDEAPDGHARWASPASSAIAATSPRSPDLSVDASNEDQGQQGLGRRRHRQPDHQPDAAPRTRCRARSSRA